MTQLSTSPEQRPERPQASNGYLRPPVDVYETPQGYVLLADMPGVTADGLEVHVEHGQLTLHGKPGAVEAKAGHREFTLRDYHREFTLADELDTDHITAKFQDGVLRLEIPKAARARTRKIPIQTV